MKTLRFVIVGFLLVIPAVTSAQSLADVARAEEARRKTVKKPAKVYTNEDLKPDITATPPSAPPAAPGATEPSTQVPAVNLPGGQAEPLPPEKDPAYWAGRMNAARAALERSKVFADALQSRINALNTDFVNRDDPAQRAQIETERQKALAELERVKKEIADQTKAIATIEDEARKAGVPPGWLR